MESPLFKISKRVLEARHCELKQEGRGNRPNRAEALTAADEEKLWECGQMVLESPDALMNNLWFALTKLLGFRGSHESRQLNWGDITLMGGIKIPESTSNSMSVRLKPGQETRLTSVHFSLRCFQTQHNLTGVPLKLIKNTDPRGLRPCWHQIHLFF